jgi:nucleotide-binding universal stress UspA family protein
MSALINDWQRSLGDIKPPVPRPETILVILEDHYDSAVLLPLARTLARLEDADLHFLYGGEQPLEPKDLLKELGLSAEDLHGVVLDQIERTPDAIMRAASNTASPLVMASARPAEDDIDSPLGTLADAVLSSTLTQAVIAPPGWNKQTWEIRKIVLAHDGTPSADVAIPTAAHLARRADASVVALHVAARKAAQFAEIGSFPAPRYIDQPQHEWPVWANEFMQRMMALGASPAAINFKLLVTGGQAGSEIADFARENNADLVVMAWHGHWEAERAGTLKVVIRRSGCPAFLVCAR